MQTKGLAWPGSCDPSWPCRIDLPEDPATGSANCALVGLLTHYNESRVGSFEWSIAQGVEMGRPSLLKARAKKKDDKVISTWIGGNCVMVSEGVIYVD